MNTEIANKQETALAAPSSLMDDCVVPNDKLMIPRLLLLQSNSQAVTTAGAAIGTYYNNITEENYGEIVEFIPIKLGFGAVYLDKDEGFKCRSADGITNMFGDKCKECPFGCYYKNWSEDRMPSKCSETIDVLAIERTSKQPLVVTFKRTAYPEGKRLVTNLKLRQEALSIVLGGEKRLNEKKQAYVVPKIKAMKPITAEEREAAASWKRTFQTTAYDVAQETEVVD